MFRTLVTALVATSALALVGCGADSADADSTADTGTGADTGGGDTAEADAGPDATVDVPTEEQCIYPTHDGRVGYDKVIPDLIWSPAFRGDGSQFVFDLYEFHCSEEYDQYDTLIVLVSAGWCPNCPRLIQWLDLLGARLEQEGAMVLFVEAELNDGSPADSAAAQAHFAEFTTNETGIRVGDNSGEPANAIYESALVSAFPTSFVVRRSDMRVIASGDRSDYILPYVEIAMDPTADWSNPPAPEIVPEFPSNCSEEDEESFEPNDDYAGATALSAGQTVEGGICNGTPDYYSVATEGEWSVRMDIELAGQSTDLDIVVVNSDDEPIMNGEQPFGSFGTGQREEFSYSGPATFIVYGYNGATSPYTLTFTEN